MTLDLLITGRIATLAGDDGFGWQEVLGVRDGRIVPADADAPAVERWDLGSEHVVMPGITDAHMHLMNLVIAERQVDLTGHDLATALATIQDRHESMLAAGDSAGWLLGHGWSIETLHGWPDADSLESVAPGRAIALYSHDHHSRWVSHAAMMIAGIGAGSQSPAGGLIRLDDAGNPSGILHETAAALVGSVIPRETTDDLAAGLARVAATLAALGITGCHDPGELTSDSDLERGPLFYRGLAEARRLPFRVHSSVRAQQLESAIELGLHTGQGEGRYRMGWLKLFGDGSLGSRSAALLQPFTDAATNPPTGGPTGLVITDEEELTDLLTRAASGGIVGQVHAIGDAAVRSALDVYQKLPANDGPMRRIEHAQLVDPADMPRFGALRVAASVQPVHLRSDADPARVAWGDRSENTFPLRALVDGGALIPIGTDSPVEPPDPWPGIAVAVARRDPFKPKDQLTGAHHAIGLARALRAACLDPALVAGQQDVGRLTPGSRADLLVVPSAPFREPFDPAEFAAIRPLATLIDGETVYRNEAWSG